MRIIPASELLLLLTPGERPGVFMLAWDGQIYSMVATSASPVPASRVQTVVETLDKRFPYLDTPWTDNVDILCLPHVQWFLAPDGSPGSGGAVRGEHRENIVTLSAGEDNADLLDLIAHEMRHLWASWVGAQRTSDMPLRWAEFFAITGLNPDAHPVTGVPWDERRQELLAELVGTAAESLPLDPAMEDDRPEGYRMSALAEWALRLTPRRKRIVLRIGGYAAEVDGKSVALDQPAYIERATNRTMVPLRFVSEALGAKVDWDAATQTVTILQEVPYVSP